MNRKQIASPLSNKITSFNAVLNSLSNTNLPDDGIKQIVSILIKENVVNTVDLEAPDLSKTSISVSANVAINRAEDKANINTVDISQRVHFLFTHLSEKLNDHQSIQLVVKQRTDQQKDKKTVLKLYTYFLNKEMCLRTALSLFPENKGTLLKLYKLQGENGLTYEVGHRTTTLSDDYIRATLGLPTKTSILSDALSRVKQDLPHRKRTLSNPLIELVKKMDPELPPYRGSTERRRGSL